MRNQINIARGKLKGFPSSGTSQATGNQYANFNVEIANGTDKPDVVPMIAFGLTAEYVEALQDQDEVYIQYNLGTRSFTNEYGEERKSLSVYADEIYNVGSADLRTAGVAMGEIAADPQMKFTDEGVPNTFLSINVSNEWMTRDGEARSRVNTLTIHYTGDMAEQVAQHVESGQWAVVGYHLSSRQFDRRDGQTGYNAYIVGDWYEVDKAAGDDAPNDPFAGDIPFE